MEFIKTSIPDIILCKPAVLNDERGYFFETFRQDKLEDFLQEKINFCQDNEAMSVKGALRGLHYQLPPYAQTKMVRVVKGCVLDIAVDIRKGSKTFGKYVAIELSEENKYQLFIPPGFAHGYVVLSDEAIFAYKVDNYYHKDSERGVLYNDAFLHIDWKMPLKNIVISEKDKNQPTIQYADLFI